MSSIDHLRQEYGKDALREEEVAADPVDQFARWFADAVAASAEGSFEPNAMTLATSGKDGVPAARIVLLKGFDAGGFVFFTNYASDKGRELAENPAAALVFFWAPLERQVRITGRVEKVSESESIEYFAKRPRSSQIGALASSQSAVVANRAVLETRFAELEKRYENRDIPKPATWGGYRVIPTRYEFWQGQRSRLHDRLAYTAVETGWKIERLSP